MSERYYDQYYCEMFQNIKSLTQEEWQVVTNSWPDLTREEVVKARTIPSEQRWDNAWNLYQKIRAIDNPKTRRDMGITSMLSNLTDDELDTIIACFSKEF